MMNNLITKNLGRAFDNQLSDAVKPFTASRSTSSGDIDPVTGVYALSAEVNYSGRGTLYDYTEEEKMVMDFDVSDMKLSAIQAEVTGTPRVGDIVIIKGQEVRVLSVDPDPVDAMWEMQLRGFT